MSDDTQSESVAATGAVLQQIARRLDSIGSRLAALESCGDGDSPSAGLGLDLRLVALLQRMVRYEGLVSHALSALHHDLRDLSGRFDDMNLHATSPEVGSESGLDAMEADQPHSWDEAVFGEELAADPRLALERHALLEGLLSGDPAARGLVGQLLVFHAASPTQKPQLLKDIGEAFYRWRPKPPHETNPLESALASWLESACEAAGVKREINLVVPGMRFNASDHRANDRGVEIAEVHGWVILREDGSVYQKAQVTVR